MQTSFAIYINLPDLVPKYNDKLTYTYSQNGSNKKLRRLLIESSRGYCTYCYSRILVDNKIFAHLEHTIEKDYYPDVLEHCVPNISIACSVCNGSFKKKGQDKRSLSQDEIANFTIGLSCKKGCTKQCNNYKKLRVLFADKAGCKIILQPMGLILDKYPLKMQYDIFTQTVIPSTEYTYNKEEISFIEAHISRFKLNDVNYRTQALVNVIEDVIQYSRIPKKKFYDNLIADLFIEQLEKIQLDAAIKLCQNIKIYDIFQSK